MNVTPCKHYAQFHLQVVQIVTFELHFHLSRHQQDRVFDANICLIKHQTWCVRDDRTHLSNLFELFFEAPAVVLLWRIRCFTWRRWVWACGKCSINHPIKCKLNSKFYRLYSPRESMMWRGIHLASHYCPATMCFVDFVPGWTPNCFVMCWWMRDEGRRSRCSWIRLSCRELASWSSPKRRCAAGSSGGSARPCWARKGYSTCQAHDLTRIVSHWKADCEKKVRILKFSILLE